MIHKPIGVWENAIQHINQEGSMGARFQIRYLALFAISLAVIYATCRWGEAIFSAHGAAMVVPATMGDSASLFRTLCALLVVIIVTRILGSLAYALDQPRVLGEVVGGILLGPSALGIVAPGVAAAVFPPAAAPFLAVVSQIGILLFMFLIGLELDLSGLRRSGRAALLISHASIALPFWLGILVAFGLYETYAPAGTPFRGFALFIGVSMSVTAFPVLARILSDKGLNKTRLGALALTCAAIDDVTAWCLLALVVGLLHASLDRALATILLTGVYILFMMFILRPLLRQILPRLEKSKDHISESALAIILIGLLVSAVTTEFIGIHALFGGFFLGAIVPHESFIARDLKSRLEDLVRVFFLPAFFAFTGLRTQIGLLESGQDWLICVSLIGVATVGKFGGAFLAAKASGLSTRESSVIGVLMNTRGLVELIVLNAGLDYGVLSPKLFTMLVLMAVVTTFATGPLLTILNPSAHLQNEDNVVRLRERL